MRAQNTFGNKTWYKVILKTIKSAYVSLTMSGVLITLLVLFFVTGRRSRRARSCRASCAARARCPCTPCAYTSTPTRTARRRTTSAPSSPKRTADVHLSYDDYSQNHTHTHLTTTAVQNNFLSFDRKLFAYRKPGEAAKRLKR